MCGIEQQGEGCCALRSTALALQCLARKSGGQVELIV